MTTFDPATGPARGSFGIGTFRDDGWSFPALVLPGGTVLSPSASTEIPGEIPLTNSDPATGLLRAKSLLGVGKARSGSRQPLRRSPGPSHIS